MRLEVSPLASEIRDVVLSPAERRLMLKASALLAALREAYPNDDDDFVTDVAMAGYVCEELGREGRVQL